MSGWQYKIMKGGFWGTYVSILIAFTFFMSNFCLRWLANSGTSDIINHSTFLTHRIKSMSKNVPVSFILSYVNKGGFYSEGDEGHIFQKLNQIIFLNLKFLNWVILMGSNHIMSEFSYLKVQIAKLSLMRFKHSKIQVQKNNLVHLFGDVTIASVPPE